MFYWITNAYDVVSEFFFTYPILGYYLQGIFLSGMIFFFYLELSPQIGGIFYRPDSTGETKFNITGVIPMLLHPFKSFDFWHPRNWDLNFIVFTQIGALVYVILKSNTL